MPYDFITSNGKYRGPDGRLISRVELRGLIDKLSSFVVRRSKNIATRFDAGKITAAQFNAEMRELLKAGHIVAASVGRGGKAQMTAKDWGKVGAKIRWQYGYLDKFARKLERGAIANTANRARQYVNAIYVSYATALQETVKELGPVKGEDIKVRLITNSREGCIECENDEAEGWMAVDDMAEIGTRLCGDFCLCFLEFSDDVQGEN